MHSMASSATSRQRQVGAGERHGQQVRVGQVGAGHGAQQAAGQHQRHGFLAPAGAASSAAAKRYNWPLAL
jgi:hypothetical protein